ncbi:MAG: gliding motility-associated C-terminal domain-containing protein [Flavobacteriaceae bacterium]
MKKVIFLILFITNYNAIAQDISLLQQFEGRYDFTMIGNTLNPSENEASSNCTINTSSSANLNLGFSDNIEAAYLYWAGSGTGDLDIKLNNENITAERTFESDYFGYQFFSAYADVTNQLIQTGNGNYTVSELDLQAVIPQYCQFGINFGGWAIVIIYANSSFPVNQINVYDGMQSVPSNITIQLDDLNVIDTEGAKIGFLAWEGDSALAVNESLTINGDLIGNDLNPETNAFNGTNSFTGATDLYNMDLDFYDISDNIEVGDTTATIQLSSGQDYVMVNCVVTKLNSRPPETILNVVPNGFSPNEDDNNDTFFITDLQNLHPDFELTIYNRYGNEIYKGNRETPLWDGLYKGKKLPTATYFYVLKLNNESDNTLRGWLYLNR